MARKEAFTPIWNFDEPDGKKDRKKMTVKELDRERGKRDMDKDTEEPVYHGGMFAEDKIAHKMTKRKERAIIIVVIIVAVIVALAIGFLRSKWLHDEFARRYLASPRCPWSAASLAEAPGNGEWKL